MSVVLASTDDLRPRRRSYLVFLSFSALVGLALPIFVPPSDEKWLALGIGLASLAGALWQVFRRREVRLDAAGGLILACDSLGTAPAWQRIPLAQFDRVRVEESRLRPDFQSDYMVQLSGPGREPLLLGVKSDNRMQVVRAGVRAAAKSGLALELKPLAGVPRTIEPKWLARCAADLDVEDLPWWRQGAALVLLAANLVPLAGVLFLKWSLFSALIVFWMDNVAYMMFGFARMLLARYYGGIEAHAGHKIGALLFVGFICAAFTAFHALFLVMIFGASAIKAAGLQIPMWPWGWLQALPLTGMALSALAVLASRGFEFYDRYVAPRAYEDAEMGKQVPIGRLIMMHMGIILGGGAIALTGSPAAMLGVLVLFKSWADLAVYMDRYRSRATPTLKSLLASRT